MQPDPIIGATIGNYVVRQKLGEGGMGSVYLAEHPSIGKRVALKVLHAEFASRQDVVNRFFNEAKAVNDIQHPNIVDIVDFGQVPGHVYFIMEFLGGTSLADVLRKEGRLEPGRALAIALQIADALSASHKCGIVHRDLKPDNVMLVQRGREREFVKLLDFGIAKLTGGDASTSQHKTRAGAVMGTPNYMSPEQCEGRGTVDHRTDIYALGIVLYEMLAGKPPFDGAGFGEVLVQHLTQPPPPFPYPVPPHVEAIVARALAKAPDARFASMDEMLSAMGASPAAPLGVAAATQPTLLPRTHPGMAVPAQTTLGGAASAMDTSAGAPLTKKRGKGGLIAGLGVGVAAIAAVAFFATQGGKGAEKEAEPTQAATPAPSPTPSPVPDPSPTPTPTPSPDPTPSPVTETVTIHLKTQPAGASVVIDGASVGTTPYDLVRDKADAVLAITLELDGHEPEARKVSLAGTTTLDLELTKLAKVSKKKVDKKKVDKKSDKKAAEEEGEDDTMDPFKKRGTP